MANVKTFDLTIYLDKTRDRVFRGISRVAVKRYLEWYRENEKYVGYHVTER
jgi:hypothetical protein